jgi:integrase
MDNPSFHIVMKARFFERKDRPGRWTVHLYWKGKQYRRSHYDQLHPLYNQDMAAQIASAINAAIAKDPAGFDPRQWFTVSGYEFQFKTYAEKWLVDRLDHYAPSVVRDVNRYVYLAINHFDKTDIREIKGFHLEAFLKALPPKFSDKTKKNVCTVLHKLFADAGRSEMLPRLPAFPVIEVQEPEIKWITREWQEKIIEAMPERDRPIVLFMVTYGVRPAEARALQWDCVDFERGVITIKRTFSGLTLVERTKTRRVRTLPIVEPVASILKEIRGLGGYVFRNSKGRHYTAEIGRTWAAAVEKVGAPLVNLYQGTRHSFASQRVNSGVGLDLIRDILGHTTSETTRRYAATNLETIRRVIE